jgi:hypothetical protein
MKGGQGLMCSAYGGYVPIAPGMKIQYVVTDARRYCVEPAWCAKSFDIPFYRGLIDMAWGEISYAFPTRFSNPPQ